MAVEITGSYIGDKQVTLKHGPSGVEIITDAPLDSHGKGRTFSPTDLIAAALGSCMMTVMSIVAERNNIGLTGMHMRVRKEMSSNTPRRISSLPVSIHAPQNLLPEQREKLEKAAHSCPVHHSLHPDISVVVEFVYDV